MDAGFNWCGKMVKMGKNNNANNGLMKLALRVNLGWSLLMLVWFSYMAQVRYSHSRGVILIIAAFYVIVAILALRLKRWAIAVCVVVAALIMLRWFPMVIINLLMFIFQNAHYRDSPATIFIVAVYLVVFALPASLLCTLYFVKRRDLRVLFQRGK